MVFRCLCMVLVFEYLCMVYRYFFRMVVVFYIMVYRCFCMMVVVFLFRVGFGILIILICCYGLRKNMSMFLMMSLFCFCRFMGEFLIFKYLVIQIFCFYRLIYNIICRCQGCWLCIIQISFFFMLFFFYKVFISLVLVFRVIIRWC